MREALSMLLLGLATFTVAQNIPTTTTSKPKVTLDIPETISSDKIDIRYFMSGPFGGYGGFVRPQHNLHSYEIEAAVEGKPAKGIKIIVYSPGCAFKTYEFRCDNIQEPHAAYICDPLPQVTLQGQVSPSSVLVGHQAIVKVWYMANWTTSFSESWMAWSNSLKSHRQVWIRTETSARTCPTSPLILGQTSLVPTIQGCC